MSGADLPKLFDATAYRDFIASKATKTAPSGFDMRGSWPDLFEHQRRTLDREALAEAVGLASIGTGAADKISSVALNAADDVLRVRGLGHIASMASGARSEIDVATKATGALAVASKYLTNALSATDSDLVALMIGDRGIGIEPAKQRNDMHRSVFIMGRRASADELAA